MVRRSTVVLATVAGVLSFFVMMNAQEGGGVWGKPWNNSGGGHVALPPLPASPGPAPRRDLTGTWDAGTRGIIPSGLKDLGAELLTPAGKKIRATRRNGFEIEIEKANDPLETMGDVGGFPRNLHYELRPLQIVQTPQSVLMLYMWEKRWRAIWSDGRKLPVDPDPRWYGYSVGRWVDDYTFVAETNGMDERAWLDHHGNPISPTLRVEERYHRVNAEVLELTVTINDPTMYTKPWTSITNFPLRRVPPGTDFMEMIPSASEAQSIQKVFVDAGAPKSR